MPQPTGPLTHPLSTQVHRVQALVELAVSRGAASANLELHPAELGRVSVRLRSVAGGGLTASMSVDRPEALQALQQAADQLRKTLEERGVEVVRLEIGLSAQARGDEAKTGAGSDGRDANGAGSRRGGTDAATDHDHDDAPSSVRPLNPGALIDVHA
jgi:flagellar hook-length control protein FliK